LKAHTYTDEEIVEKNVKRWGPLWTTTKNKFVFIGTAKHQSHDDCWQGFETLESYRALSSLLSGLAELAIYANGLEEMHHKRIYEKLKFAYDAFDLFQFMKPYNVKQYNKNYPASLWRQVIINTINIFFRLNPVNLVFDYDNDKNIKVVLDMRYGVTRILFHQLAKALVREKKTNGIFICDNCLEPYLRTKKFISGKKQYCNDCENS
jgi:hypothetical protein